MFAQKICQGLDEVVTRFDDLGQLVLCGSDRLGGFGRGSLVTIAHTRGILSTKKFGGQKELFALMHCECTARKVWALLNGASTVQHATHTNAMLEYATLARSQLPGPCKSHVHVQLYIQDIRICAPVQN